MFGVDVLNFCGFSLSELWCTMSCPLGRPRCVFDRYLKSIRQATYYGGPGLLCTGSCATPRTDVKLRILKDVEPSQRAGVNPLLRLEVHHFTYRLIGAYLKFRPRASRLRKSSGFAGFLPPAHPLDHVGLSDSSAPRSTRCGVGADFLPTCSPVFIIAIPSVKPQASPQSRPH